MENRNFEGFIFTFYSKKDQTQDPKTLESISNQSAIPKIRMKPVLRPLRNINENLNEIQKNVPSTQRHRKLLNDINQSNITDRNKRDVSQLNM